MKKFFSIFAIVVLAAFNGNAIIRTVSNVPSTLAQFNTIQAAVDASSSGDTVYVHGSPNNYAAFTITNKQLVIIGPGWSPDKNLPLTAIVLGITITGAASGNTEIQGLVISGSVVVNSNHPDNLRFIRNQFTQGQSLFFSRVRLLIMDISLKAIFFKTRRCLHQAAVPIRIFFFKTIISMNRVAALEATSMILLIR